MFNWISSIFKNEEQSGEFNPPNHTEIIFILTYKDLLIGMLTYEKDNWIFQYSEQFKNQSKIDSLLDFPNKDQIYKSSHLWPFFAHRIPGLGQPMIQKIIEHEKINPKNEIDLLRRFGKKSISNPFELAVSA